MPRVWQDTDRFVLVLFAIALVVNAAGMTEMTQVVTESFAEDRAGSGIVAYRTQGALAFWPLLFLTARLRRPRTMLLSSRACSSCWRSRSSSRSAPPRFRIVLFVLVFLFVLPRLRRSDRGPPPCASAACACCSSAPWPWPSPWPCAAPWLFQGQLAGLVGAI